MDGGRITIGSVGGIEIRIHRSWLIIALLIAWSFWTRFAFLAGRSGELALAMALVATVLFFGSVLVHELSHSLEAQHRGVRVGGITLFLFGGATETTSEVDRPRDEFALTAVGPFSSFVLAAVFGLIAYYSEGAGLQVVAEVAGLLGWINLALGIFNLLPGAPLDGGRIVRAAVWAATGDRRRAVAVASRSGQVIGYLIAGLGVLQLLFVPGALLGGIWFVFIGMFLASAAKSEVIQHQMRDRLQGVTVGDMVSEDPLPEVDAGTDLATVSERLRRQPEDALAVTDGGRTTGIVLLEDVAGVPSDRRDRPVSDVVVPLDELRTVPADMELTDAMGALGAGRPLAVTGRRGDTERILGIITPERLQRVIDRTMRLGAEPRTVAEQQRADERLPHLPEQDRP